MVNDQGMSYEVLSFNHRLREQIQQQKKYGLQLAQLADDKLLERIEKIQHNGNRLFLTGQYLQM